VVQWKISIFLDGNRIARQCNDDGNVAAVATTPKPEGNRKGSSGNRANVDVKAFSNTPRRRRRRHSGGIGSSLPRPRGRRAVCGMINDRSRVSEPRQVAGIESTFLVFFFFPPCKERCRRKIFEKKKKRKKRTRTHKINFLGHARRIERRGGSRRVVKRTRATGAQGHARTRAARITIKLNASSSVSAAAAGIPR